jgi:amidase/aspartyl-tRNA(Asn)/glutamyl-tRNA(Gln) amidotransferase subunit A
MDDKPARTGARFQLGGSVVRRDKGPRDSHPGDCVSLRHRDDEPMSFQEWQPLVPAAAAREVHERIRTRLTPGQQRAAIAQLLPEPVLGERLANARAGAPLSGIPYFAKDLFDTAGWPTLAGSTFLPEVRPAPAGDSALVRALASTGAVLAGKTHLHEFAYGITGENPHYGDCEHPGFPGRTTGGSSSGSAALVAAGVVPLALGTDTGGSVRLPAAFCGLFGYRLTPGDPFIRDAVALAPSYDTAGWFAANATDLLTATQALVALERGGREPRGIYLEMPGLDTDVALACRNAARPFTIPPEPAVRDSLLRAFAPSVDTYNTTVALEAWEVHRGWAERYRDRYSPGVWQRLNRAHGITPAQIAAARENTAAVHSVWREYFSSHDFLVIAASPTPALTKAECTLENRGRILALTAPASIGGLPVLTVPVMLPSGMTTGLQIIVREPRSAVVAWALKIFGAM